MKKYRIVTYILIYFILSIFGFFVFKARYNTIIEQHIEYIKNINNYFNINKKGNNIVIKYSGSNSKYMLKKILYLNVHLINYWNDANNFYIEIKPSNDIINKINNNNGINENNNKNINYMI